MSWKTNPIMEWSDNEGLTWNLITDHGRGPLDISYERIEQKTRMYDGTLRRYVVAKKRSWTVSWENLPSKEVTLLAGGKPGDWIDEFHKTHDGDFLVRFRNGNAIDTTPGAGNSEVVRVMIGDFSKEVVKRTKTFDLWSLDLTLEEV